VRFLFLVLGLLSNGYAGDLSRIVGVVTDPSGAAIPDAQISVDNRGTSVEVGSTDKSGRFSTRPLPRGRYVVDISKSGFEAQRRLITLAGADNALNIVLPLAKQQYSVTVDGGPPELDTGTTSHQDLLRLDQTSFTNLPIKDGEILSALNSLVNPAGGAAPTVVVDGMERDDADLPPGSIDEVRINNNAYSAEFPKPGKDRIEIDTRGGADEVHGGFGIRARNSTFDARNPLAPNNSQFARYGYEANLSGPIVKQRLTFFLDANSEQQQQLEPVVAYLPSGLFQTSILSPLDKNRFLGRLDWQVNQSHRIGVKYELHIDKTGNNGVGGFALPELATNLYHHDYRIEISDQYVLSPEALNNFRIAVGTNHIVLTSANDQPQIVVQGAFSSGGAQVNEWREEPRTDMQDTLSYAKGPNNWKFGAVANLHPFRSYNADNFGGTYTYASLAAYEAQQPELFTITTGNPLSSFQQDDYAWFAQYERQFQTTLGNASLFTGVRHEFQSNVSRYGNVAPRLALAFSPGKDHRTVIRAGAGFFYDRRPPPFEEQALRYNGIQTQQFVLPNPVYPVADPALLSSILTPTVWRIDPSLTFPRIYQASATVERQLPGGFILTADYTYQRGAHLFQARDINAPLPATGVRPLPGEGNIDQLESSASSRGDIVNWTLKSPSNGRFQFFAQYTLSWLYDDTGGVFPPPPGTFTSAGGLFAALLPANSYDLRSEWGRANNDALHRFGLSGTVQLPWKLTFGTLTTIRSGLPFDITTGQDNPEGVANVRPPGVTRNAGNGPGQISVDAHLGRKISFHAGERKIDASLGIDSFNVLNHTNLNSYVGVITSPLFGQANSAMNGREMQFTLQARF
jgi:hypothetical protein